MLGRINGVDKKADEPEKVVKAEFTEQDFQNSEFLKDFKVAIP